MVEDTVYSNAREEEVWYMENRMYRLKKRR